MTKTINIQITTDPGAETIGSWRKYLAWYDSPAGHIDVGIKYSAREIFVVIQEWAAASWPEDPEIEILIKDLTP